MIQHPQDIAIDYDGQQLIANFDQRSIIYHLSDEEFWQQYSHLWAKVKQLPFNQTPLLHNGQLLSFDNEEIRAICQFQVLYRLRMREAYPTIPDSFGNRCLKSGELRSYVLAKAGKKLGVNSEAAIRLTAHFLRAQTQSLRSLIAVKKALHNH